MGTNEKIKPGIHQSLSQFFGYFGFGLILNVPVNNYSVMLGRSHRFLGITSTFFLFFFFFGGGGQICLAQGHNTATRVGLEPPTSGSGVRGVNHQATAPPGYFGEFIILRRVQGENANEIHHVYNAMVVYYISATEFWVFHYQDTPETKN